MLVDERVSARQDPEREQTHIWRLGSAINASLKAGMRRRTEEAGEEVERLLGADPPLHREAWRRMKGGYRSAVDRAPLPNWVTFEQITAEWVDLYRHVPPPGEKIPVSVEPFSVEDSVPTEDDIEWATKQLCNHCFEALSGMRAENLKGWLAKLRKEVVAAEKYHQ